MGLFDNAKTVTINNKEVKSLKIGTAIIWEKGDSPTPTKLATHITKSGNYLYLYDENNTALASKPVKAYRNGKLQNTYTTNSSGRFTYNNKYNYEFEEDSNYYGCTYP